MSALLELSQPRQIRVFVSSTFRDMHAEREELVKQVFPQLRSLCERRAVIWGDVELRWGVTDERRAEGSALPICLTEIERCRPYFIGLLGERYGAAVDKIHPDALAREPWLKDHVHCSLTELEILHGVLRDPASAQHSFFYFRDPNYLNRLPPDVNPNDFRSQNASQTEQLRALKARIRTSGFPVQDNYADPKTLGQLVLADFTALIERLYPEDSRPNSLDREAMEQGFYAASRERTYIRRQSDFDALDRHAAGEGKPLVVLGGPGIGKSALLANWTLSYRKAHPEDFVLLHFVGATSSSGDWVAMLRRIMGEFERYFGGEERVPDEREALRAAFETALHSVAGRGRMLIVLDALNQLEDGEGAQELAWLPERIPPNVRLVISTLPGRPLEEANRRQWPTLTVQPLEAIERRQLIHVHLQQFAKELSQEQVERISDSHQAANPLYLRALLEELRQHGVHEQLEERIRYYLAAQTAPELYGRILERYELDYNGERSGLVKDTFTLIWASQRGLSEAELLDALGVDDGPLPKPLWLPLMYAAADSLIDRAGILTFSHEYLRQAVQGKYLPEDEDQLEVRRRLARYFADRDTSSRKVTELPWLYQRCGEWTSLRDLLVNQQFFEATSNDQLRIHWLAIERNSCHRALQSYSDVMESPEAHAWYAFRLSLLMHGIGYPGVAHQLSHKLAEYFRSRAAPLLDRLEQYGLNTVQIQLVHEFVGPALKDVITSGLQFPDDSQDQVGTLVNALKAKLDIKDNFFEPVRDLWVALGHLANTLQRDGDLKGVLEIVREQKRICQLCNYGGAMMQATLRNEAAAYSSMGYNAAARAIHDTERQYAILEGRHPPSNSDFEASRLYESGDLAAAFDAYRRSEREARVAEDGSRLIGVLVGQSTILSREGRHREALTRLDQAERLCCEGVILSQIPSVLNNRSAVLLDMGEVETALQASQEAERLARRMGQTEDIATSFIQQAFAHQRLKNSAQAESLLGQYVQECRERRDFSKLIDGLILLSGQLRKRGATESAIAAIREAEELCREHSLFAELLTAQFMLGAMLAESGRVDEALPLNQEAEAMARDLQDWNHLQLILNNRSVILQKMGDLAAAMTASEEEERLCRRLGKIHELTISLENQAFLHGRMKHKRQALEKIDEACFFAGGNGLTDRAGELEKLRTRLQSEVRPWWKSFIPRK